MIVTLIAIAFIAGCDSPRYGDPQPVEPSTRTPLNIKSQITCANFDMKDGCNFDVTGNTSCNLSECIKIGLHGDLNEINQLPQALELEFRNGYFELIDDDQFSYLAGNLEGTVIRSNNDLKVSGLIAVKYGQGTFDADAGELMVSIIGIPDQNDESLMNLHIDIKGFIKKNNPGYN